LICWFPDDFNPSAFFRSAFGGSNGGSQKTNLIFANKLVFQFVGNFTSFSKLFHDFKSMNNEKDKLVGLKMILLIN